MWSQHVLLTHSWIRIDLNQPLPLLLCLSTSCWLNQKIWIAIFISPTENVVGNFFHLYFYFCSSMFFQDRWVFKLTLIFLTSLKFHGAKILYGKKKIHTKHIQIYVGRKVPKGNEWLVVVYFPSVTLLELSTVELYCPMITFSSVFIDQREADATISNFFAGINISNSVICLVTFKLWFLVLVSQAREYRYQETTGVCIYGSVYGSKNDACFNFVHVGSQLRFRHCSQHNWHTKDSLTLEIQKV